MTKEEKRKHCIGCIEDFYNGKNPYGIKECWNLEKAKLVLRKKIPFNQRPPWKQKPIKVLSCYRQRYYVFWAPDKEY
jgi:hypothetical protein